MPIGAEEEPKSSSSLSLEVACTSMRRAGSGPRLVRCGEAYYARSAAGSGPHAPILLQLCTGGLLSNEFACLRRGVIEKSQTCADLDRLVTRRGLIAVPG
jgi:hypothetical protein